jgi:3-hydroxyacyl-[acyl-carrier-protein] dehydratase
MFDIREIMKAMPHRPPFLFLDRIVEWEPGVRIVAIKNVTINEPFFQGHFPGRPIMPGVLIVEAMAQAGGFLALKAGANGKQLAYFAGIDQCKFRRPVGPGDQLRLEATVVARKGSVWKMHGEATVNGILVAKANMTATTQAMEETVEGGGGA